MPDIRYIDKDFVRFNFIGFDGQETKATLAFGDKVEVLEEGSASPVVSVPSTLRWQSGGNCQRKAFVER